MKAVEFRKKNKADLMKEFTEKKKAIFNMGLLKDNGKTKNTKEVNAIRKDIARIMTVLKELNNLEK